jgi:hypothetical protein
METTDKAKLSRLKKKAATLRYKGAKPRDVKKFEAAAAERKRKKAEA